MSTNEELRAALEDVVARDVEELVRKDAEYGSSWKRRGGVGAFMMLARKWDRIENYLQTRGWDILGAALEDRRLEGLRDDIGDLRRYLMLVGAELAAKAPAHDAWLARFPRVESEPPLGGQKAREVDRCNHPSPFGYQEDGA